MYRQIVVPTEKEHSIDLPEDLYGKMVEVIAFPLSEVTNVPASVPNDADAFYNSIRLDFSGFKFDRDEANER